MVLSDYVEEPDNELLKFKRSGRVYGEISC
jgi:hypothetical protein